LVVEEKKKKKKKRGRASKNYGPGEGRARRFRSKISVAKKTSGKKEKKKKFNPSERKPNVTRPKKNQQRGFCEHREGCPVREEGENKGRATVGKKLHGGREGGLPPTQTAENRSKPEKGHAA